MKTNRVVILCGLLLLTGAAVKLPVGNSQTSAPPYKNPSLPIERRVDDLISRMTLEEKISQMMNGAAAIDRLGIPEYEWWNECRGYITPIVPPDGDIFSENRPDCAEKGSTHLCHLHEWFF